MPFVALTALDPPSLLCLNPGNSTKSTLTLNWNCSFLLYEKMSNSVTRSSKPPWRLVCASNDKCRALSVCGPDTRGGVDEGGTMDRPHIKKMRELYDSLRGTIPKGELRWLDDEWVARKSNCRSRVEFKLLRNTWSSAFNKPITMAPRDEGRATPHGHHDQYDLNGWNL